MHRTGERLAKSHRALLLVSAVGSATACSALGGPAGGPLPEFEEYAGREITEVSFLNPAPFSEDTLETIIETQATHCNFAGLHFCIPFTDIGEEEHTLELPMLATDVVRLAVFYRQAGFFGTRVRPGVQPRGGAVAVTFAILRGDSVMLDTLELQGMEGVLDEADLREAIPTREGELFDVGDFFESADTVRARMLAQGYAYAEVLRNYGVDTIQDRAIASIGAVPGPQVRIDSIIVQGAENLGRSAALRQLAFSEGDLLRASDLTASQRNLYVVDLVQFATVGIAPDSLQLVRGDSSTATVLVQITEGPVHVVDASVGYGSVECLRSEATWTSRSLFGGGRRLSVRGDVSKLGIGQPTDWGLESSICRAYQVEDVSGGRRADLDRFRRTLDYGLAVDFTQPYLFSPLNQLAIGAYSERVSEPGLYQRLSTGGRLGVTRRLLNGDVISIGGSAERGKTVASEAIFCLALGVCQRTVIDQLNQPRWRNLAGVTFARDRTDQVLDPSRGYRTTTSLLYATPLLGSDVEFVRWAGDVAYFHALRPGWIAGANLRLGSFFGTASITSGIGETDFLPPEDRFYAGGATSVRGFGLNELGPGVYVSTQTTLDSLGNLAPDTTVTPAFVPVGGTSLAIASFELRFPSPFLRDYVRLAAFVDAGSLGPEHPLTTDKESGVFELGAWHVTPGAGLRIDTPVGPARLDVAYNPHDPPTAPLVVSDLRTGELVRIRNAFSVGARDFWDRLRVHVAVGQAF
ncbi:MAG: BamA/OMP85 family outer membrane protein [Longimicrobiales bacterium]